MNKLLKMEESDLRFTLNDLLSCMDLSEEDLEIKVDNFIEEMRNLTEVYYS